jgi:phenylalanyl-tRNA synthetase beta chain
VKFPLSWLSEFIRVDQSLEELSDSFATLGFKVESIERPGAAVSGVVAGKVAAIERHPRADQLILVDVDVGGRVPKIVCGAENFSVGDTVPVALPGATLPGQKVEQATIRGVASEGMLCSPRELGVSDDHSGIMVLNGNLQPGEDIRAALGLDEAVLDLEVTPNRPDAMSLIGLARELSALTKAEWALPEFSLPKGGDPVDGLADVEVDDPQGCPRYLARVILDVRVGPSPDRVQRRLYQSGIRPVSNVVDATNYGMLVTGHPMHAFDMDRLDGPRIVVRRARAGERLVTIDGDEHELDPDDLLICDPSRPLAIAGVMGGAESEVSPDTRRVLLESAYFDPTTIFRASKRHGLRSESSARFERGADPNAADIASRYASRLMIEWGGGSVAEGTLDRYPKPIEPWDVSLRPPRANLVLGTRLSSEDIEDPLARLEFEPAKSNGQVRVRVPTHRPDVRAEEDLIEEVARLIGYEKIPGTLPAGSNRSGFLTPEQKLVRAVRASLVSAGLYEAQTSSLIAPADLDRVGYPQDHEARSAIRLANPLSQEASLLRPSLLPGLLNSVALNVARRNLGVRLFEIGRCFLPSGELLPSEPQRIGIAMHGPVDQTWLSEGREMDLFDLKGAIESLLRDRFGGTTFEATEDPTLHRGRTAAIHLDGSRIGMMGELSGPAQSRYDLPHRVMVAEIDLDALIERSRWSGLIEVPRFPATLRDIALAVPEETPAGDVFATVRSAGGEVLDDARIFDVYRGQQAGEGRKSIAISLVFRRTDRTLTDDEVQSAVDEITRAVEKNHGGQIRR